MMNAEQLQAMKIDQERAAAERIRRENAVALLAEKEREIAQEHQIAFHLESALTDLRERLRQREAELEQRDPTGRTPKDYAIEFGEYLAKAAEQYLEQRNLYDANESDSDSLMDAWRALRSSIGEFRKRAARAALPSPPKEGATS